VEFRAKPGPRIPDDADTLKIILKWMDHLLEGDEKDQEPDTSISREIFCEEVTVSFGNGREGRAFIVGRGEPTHQAMHMLVDGSRAIEREPVSPIKAR
jgi:hypothetical protein